MNIYFDFNSNDIIYKAEELLEASTNRYQITVQVAKRAKRSKYENIDLIDDPKVKPVLRAILEMVDEVTRPEILSD